MYLMKKLEELKKGDKVLAMDDDRPLVVTVDEVDLEDDSFVIKEGGLNVYLYQVAVLTDY